ncbi:MAG: MltA domain-containing protein [Proteobacteria bacterium]|nr:MltA domain-containing protein [Pseudomonadota bacterium]
MNSTPATNLNIWTQVVLINILIACSSPPVKKDPAPPEQISTPPEQISTPTSKESRTSVPRDASIAIKPTLFSSFGLKSKTHLTLAGWKDLPGWLTDEISDGTSALLQSCTVLDKYAEWTLPCQQAQSLKHMSKVNQRQFYETHFVPFKVNNQDGASSGLVTGYYEPLLQGSVKRSRDYPYPAYGVPDDLVSVDVRQYPLFKEFRGVGRRSGTDLIPYFTREEIDKGLANLHGKEILWVKDKVELFFLQIQGSGRIQLDDGSIIRLGFAKSNGHPYRSIGKSLVSKGELKLSQASMQGIKLWGERNPDKIDTLLQENPSYVFFRKLPANLGGPIGSLGVPLTANRSIAVDDTYIPAGFPVYLATSWPNSSDPLNQLMFAQDRGGAIKGAVRADYFWGFGESAAINAGKMKQEGLMWVLIPKTFLAPENQE